MIKIIFIVENLILEIYYRARSDERGFSCKILQYRIIIMQDLIKRNYSVRLDNFELKMLNIR